MPSLKFLKDRIKSVKSTQKITRAMQLISATRLNKAKWNLELSRPYTAAIAEMITSIADNQKTNIPTEGEGHLILVITSNRGLCGAFNAAIIKKVKEYCAGLEAAQKKFYLMCIGKRGYESLVNFFCDKQVIKLSTAKQIDIQQANDIAGSIIADFNMGKFTALVAVFNKFISVMKQETVLNNILPLAQENNKFSSKSNDKLALEFEPALSEVINQLIEKYLAAFIYNMLLENAASEHSARMTAMDNATRNVREMLHKLNHQHNRTRQTLITKELIEIISGAQAT